MLTSAPKIHRQLAMMNRIPEAVCVPAPTFSCKQVTPRSDLKGQWQAPRRGQGARLGVEHSLTHY